MSEKIQKKTSGAQNRKRRVQSANVTKKLDGSIIPYLEVLEPPKKVKKPSAIKSLEENNQSLKKEQVILWNLHKWSVIMLAVMKQIRILRKSFKMYSL